MAGQKLEYVKKAVQFLVQHLKADDGFSLVTYDDVVTVDVRPTQVIFKDAINQRIETIRTGNATNLSGGRLRGCQFVADGIGRNQSDRVLLLTDGLANRGITDPEQLTALARQKREAGVTTTTIGVGMDFNEDLLKTMSPVGSG
jgi:Ca-activated chloride channel family protein